MCRFFILPPENLTVSDATGMDIALRQPIQKKTRHRSTELLAAETICAHAGENAAVALTYLANGLLSTFWDLTGIAVTDKVDAKDLLGFIGGEPNLFPILDFYLHHPAREPNEGIIEESINVGHSKALRLL